MKKEIWNDSDVAEYLPMRRGEVETDIVATGEGWELLGWKPEFRIDDLIESVNYYKNFSIN